jgi:hypothetical protein
MARVVLWVGVIGAAIGCGAAGLMGGLTGLIAGLGAGSGFAIRIDDRSTHQARKAFSGGREVAECWQLLHA